MEKKQSFKGVPESNPINGKSQMRQEIIKVTSQKSFEKMIEMLESMDELIFEPSRNYDKVWPTFSFDFENEPPLWTRDTDKIFTITDIEFLEKYKPEPKTRKPGVKYTLEDWKKEADTCRKRAEYWKNKFQEMETRHFAQTGSLLGEMDAINEEMEATKAKLTERELHLKWAHQANTTLQDSNVELRGANDELIKQLELQTKGIQSLEEDARNYRLEIGLWKSDFETKNAELEIMEEDYNALKNNKKHTTVLTWVGWIMFFVCLFGFIFLK